MAVMKYIVDIAGGLPTILLEIRDIFNKKCGK